jgi:hypothetical protein
MIFSFLICYISLSNDYNFRLAIKNNALEYKGFIFIKNVGLSYFHCGTMVHPVCGWVNFVHVLNFSFKLHVLTFNFGFFLLTCNVFCLLCQGKLVRTINFCARQVLIFSSV